MKFDFVIGNPPYQEDTLGDNKGYAPPVYNRFLDAAYEVADKVEMIHPARFLFNAGSTPKAWNEKMLNDEHFKVLEYEDDASRIFPNTDIKGGVVITYHDVEKEFGAIKTFTKHPVLNNILKKVAPKNVSESLMNIIFLQSKFDLLVLYEDYPQFRNIVGSGGKDKRFRNNIFDKISLFSAEKQNTTDIKVLGVSNNKRVWKYIPEKYVDKEQKNLPKWKVLVVRVNGSGSFGEVLSTPLIASPYEAYTQTFIGIGAYESECDAENTLKYVKSKFCRTMLGVLKITQDNNRETWRMVPLQDFSSSSDIDWTQPIANIDKQLYKKYNLSNEEINFIETNVKEME